MSSGTRKTAAFRRWVGPALVAAAVLWGVSGAVREAWTCDDAFIVFRYAKNAASGLGLVFNASERVEGFTDLLWVLWTVPAFLLGISPETWANAWGVAAYAGTLALLGLDHLRLVRDVRSPPWVIPPVAAFAAAAHPDWNVWATSGLETSAFTFFLVAGYVLLVGPLSPRRAFVSGLVFSLAVLVRPDGAIPAAVGGLFVFARTRRLGPVSAYAGGVALLGIPAAIFRLAYYRTLVPNTYWAKSADVAWWGQGFRYLGLYFDRYGILVLGPLLLLVVALLWGREEPDRRAALASAWRPRLALAAALAVSYSLYVARVGGDFMYARMLIPATPFFLLLFELGYTALPARVPAAVPLAAAALVVAVPALVPSPVSATNWVDGVADERAYYDLKKTTETDFRGAVLERFFSGLPVRMLAYGSEIRLAYRAEAPLVVEAHGLTDPAIAHQPLHGRGRPGHEHLPDPAYAVLKRKLDVAFHRSFYERTGFPSFIPVVPVRFGPVEGFLLRWDPSLLAEWRKRGARFADFPAFLDAYVEKMGEKPDETVRQDYAKFRNFYFAHVSDPARERRFLERLGAR